VVFLHEIRGLSARTGYGGAFQALYYALMKLYPGRVISHPFFRLTGKPEIDCDVFFGQPYNRFLDDFERRHCEQYFDFIIVPTRWCQKVFEQTFPDHPVYLCPLGVNPDIYPMLHRPLDRHPFTFLWQGFVVNDRKRADLVLRAFKELDLPNSRLIVKYLPDISKSKIKHILSDSKITMIGEQFSFPEMLSLWQECDFGVFPSEGEGVGLIPLECMTTGMPVAIANNTGAADYCDNRYNFPLECKETADSYFQDGSRFAVPTLEAIKTAMSKAYHERAAVQRRGKAAGSWIRANHTNRHSAQKFMAVIDEVMGS